MKNFKFYSIQSVDFKRGKYLAINKQGFQEHIAEAQTIEQQQLNKNP